MLEKPRLSSLATGQLAAWETLARDWPTVAMLDPGSEVRVERCGSCWVGVYRLTDEHGAAYQYSDEEKLALVVAHLRQAHMHLDPDRP